MNNMKLFIEERTKKKLISCINTPILIEQEGNRERADLRDYHGRELLELLQNADDEITHDLPKKVLISFKNGNLQVSNFGAPFSEDGILSLMYSNVSAKRERLKETIGNKGTGFRSILSWAKEIEINSGDLHIRFSDDYSKSVVRNALDNSQEDSEEYSSVIEKVATLAFPEWIEDYDHTDEYTTTISIRIQDDQTISDDILKQIQNLDQNILLFLNNTEELKIETEDFNVLFIKKIVQGKTVLRKYEDNDLKNERFWTTVKRDGTLIDNSDESKEKTYHVVVAFCDDELEDKEKYLYSYFKTEEEFPYPFLVHASFELKGDRNHLTESEINKTLLSVVAETMVEAAIKAGTRKKANYGIVEKLISEKALSKALTESIADFHKMVIEATKNNGKPILPNVNGKYIKDEGKNIIRFYNGLSKYLNGKDFGNLLQHMEEGSPVDRFINEYIGRAPYFVHTYDLIAPKVNQWVKNQKLKTDNEGKNKEKLRIILKTALAFFDEYGSMYDDDDEIFPGLFINSERKVVPGRTPIFVVEDEELHISRLPKFAQMEFMEPYMAAFLLNYLRQDNGTDFHSLEELADYNVRPFNADEIIAHLNDCLEHSMENDTSTQTKKNWKKVIKWIWDNKDCFHDEQISVYFLARDKKYYKSDELYMGKEYGATLLENLLGGYPSKIAADFRDNTGLDLTDEQIQEFMTFLGIERLPRINYELFKVYHYGRPVNIQSDYVGKVMSLLSFPYKLDEYDKFESLYDCWERLTYIEFNGYKIEELEDILKTSRTEDIVEWIKEDSRLQDILFSWRGGRKTKFEIKWDKKGKPREIGELTRPYPYILHLFNTVPWIEVDKQRYCIGDCLIGLNDEVDLSPFLIRPDISEYIKNLNGKPGQLRNEYINLFQKLGMKKGFSDGGFAELPVGKIYTILKNLPEIKGSKKVAKDMYECLVAEMNDANIQCKERTDFLENGKVLCNTGYVNVPEAYYLAEKTVSDRITDNFNIIKIGSRQGSAKIEKLFGVKRIDIKGKIIGTPERHPQSQTLEDEFKRFLPMAFACRLAGIKSETDAKDEARKINNIEMILCTKVEAVYNDTIQIQLDDYEFILSEDHKVYIKAPESLQRSRIRHNMDLSIAVAEAMCSSLDIAGAVDSFRELFYCGTNKDRAEVIKTKFEDTTLVDRAKRYLDFKEDVQEEFGRILKTIVGSEVIDQDVINGLDYDDFSGIGNSRAIIGLFRELGIDISDYNAEGPSVEINLIPYYEGEIERLKPKYREEYKISCFRRLENKSLDEKIFLVDDFLDFDQITISAENSVRFDVVTGLKKGLHIIPDAKPIKLADLYKRNLKNWKNKITMDQSYAEEFFTDPKNMSLLYYSEYKALDERYEQYVNDQVEEEESTISVPAKQVLQEDMDSEIIPAEQPHGKTSKSGKTGFVKKESSAESERTGLIGEQLVYDWLGSDKSIKHVNWVSENAKKAGVNPEGRAGLGYDFEIINENDERLLIEVKASKNPIQDGIRFHLSDNEYSVALENGKKYIVYYIGDARSNTPVLKKLTDLFHEDFNTEKYTVECKSDYTISAFTK